MRSPVWTLLLALSFAAGCSQTVAIDRNPEVASTQPASADAGIVDAAGIQAALDAAAATGGVVRLEARRYRLDRPITIPRGVTLAGVWESPHHAELSSGTVFEVTANHGEEDGPPLVSLNRSSTIRGITFYYPNQRIPATPYPWTIQGRDMHNSVIDCTFVNAYKAIDFGTHANELHYIRNCFGCPLRIGVHIDRCTDIGRIENVHFNPHYWMRAEASNAPNWPELLKYLFENFVAFEFGRTDWEYVHNTFCFGAKIGYRFYNNPDAPNAGTVNGNFLGIGADWCHRAVLVEASQMPGLLITNGEFVGGEGSDAMVEVLPENRGVVHFNNCAFWGPCERVAILRGRSTTSFFQCNFMNWTPQATGAFTIEAEAGDVTIQGCRFGIARPDIRLGPDVSTAIIAANWFHHGKQIENNSGGDVQQGLNVETKPPAQ